MRLVKIIKSFFLDRWFLNILFFCFVHFLEVIPGRGSVDYRAYLIELAKLPVDAPLMLEHLKTAEEYDEGRNYIQKVGREAGATFL